MPTFLALREHLLVTLDAINLLRRQDGQWRAWLTEPLIPDAAETVILMRYLRHIDQQIAALDAAQPPSATQPNAGDTPTKCHDC